MVSILLLGGLGQEAVPALISKMRLILAILFSAVVVGCASTSGVTSTQLGHLAVSARGNLNSEFVSWASVKNTAVDRATAYCSAQGKQISQIGASTDGMMRLSSDKVTIVFDCV